MIPCFSRSTGAFLSLLLALLGAPKPAFAYGVKIHQSLADLAWAEDPPFLADVVPGGNPADLLLLRVHLYTLLATSSDPSLKARFLARYPEEASFTSPAAFKEFLSLNPAATVWGIDRLQEEPLPRGLLLGEASAHPDLDRRNQDRWWRGEGGVPRRDAAGRPLPADPAILWLGSSQGLSSQAHAHYGLTRRPHSSDPAALKTDPVRFTLPEEARAFGDDMAESYTALSWLASRLALPSSPHLRSLFQGAAFHHLQDVCNQIHTVQVGLYDFFVSAKIQSLVEEGLTGGGLWGKRRGFKGIGLRILSNHHLMSEQLLAKRVGEALSGRSSSAVIQQGIGAISRDLSPPPPWRKEVAAAPPQDFARTLFQALVEEGGAEGVTTYRLTRSVADSRLSSRNVEFRDEVDNPDAFLDTGGATGEDSELNALYRVQMAGMIRAGEAMRLWEREAQAFESSRPEPGSPDPSLQAVLNAFAFRRLDALDQEETRRAAFTPENEGEAPVALWVWGVYPLPLIAVVALRALRRRQRATP